MHITNKEFCGVECLQIVYLFPLKPVFHVFVSYLDYVSLSGKLLAHDLNQVSWFVLPQKKTLSQN